MKLDADLRGALGTSFKRVLVRRLPALPNYCHTRSYLRAFLLDVAAARFTFARDR